MATCAALFFSAGCDSVSPTRTASVRTEIYPPPLGPAELRISASLEGRQLPLVTRKIYHSDSKGQNFMEVAFARFASDGNVEVSLQSNQGDLKEPVLRAVGKDIAVAALGRTVKCKLPGPGQYYLQLPALAQSNNTFTVTLWVDDLRQLEAARAQFQASSVARRGIKPDAELDQTAAIQALLDKGGNISFPPGVYRAGTLRLRSNTTVFLSPGAVLRAVDREDGVANEFIAVENARNVKLFGPGTVDANSFTRRRAHGVRSVDITSSQNVTFEDVLFEESSSWGLHIRKSDQFTARNVKVFSGKDGFDPDASRDVLIENAFVISADDSVAVKNRFPDDPDGKSTERIRFRNSIVSSQKSALKIGTETRGLIRDVTFENCDVFDGERGIVLYARDGGPIERAVWRGIRLFMHNWPQEKDSGSVFHVNIERRERATPVRDCIVENVTANWIHRSQFAGLSDAPLDGISLRNITAFVDAPKGGRPSLFDCGQNVNLKLEGLKVEWRGHQADWAGVLSGNGLSISGLQSISEGKPSAPEKTASFK